MDKTFHFHALATGVSGKITLPFQDIVEIQPTSAIPNTGGFTSTRTENFRFKEIISFGSAGTVASGSFSETDQSYNTLVTAWVEKLNILNLVTADRLVARLASRQPKEGGPPSILPMGSTIDNLRIAGSLMQVTLDSTRLAYSPPRPAKTDLQSLAKVDLKNSPHLELLPDGGIMARQFGKIYLAELLTTPSWTSVTMLRVELGCAVEGRVVVATGQPMESFTLPKEQLYRPSRLLTSVTMSAAGGPGAIESRLAFP